MSRAKWIPGKLHVSGQDSVRITIEDLLSKLEEYERVIDQVWQNLVPVAEMAAIDFSENLDPRDPSPHLWRNPNLSAEEREKVDEQKARHVQAAVAEYPPGFGRLHLTFGSYQEAVRQAWIAYNKIDDDFARQELLRFSMSSFAPVENQLQYAVMDSIELILNNAALAQQHHPAPAEAALTFFIERTDRAQAVLTWLDFLVAQIFKSMESTIKEAWSVVDVIQEVREKISQEPGKWGMPYALTVGIYDVVDGGSGLWFSLLRFVWNTDGGGIARINPVFLDVLGEMVPSSDPTFPIRWLFQLLFREVFRLALKTGEQIVCPFKGYEISSSQREEALKCSANCLMRQLLTRVSRWSNLVSDDAFCEIPTASSARRNSRKTKQRGKNTSAPEKSSVQELQRQVESPMVADTMIEAHKEIPRMTERLCCSFCGKSQDEVRKLIAGQQAYICNECIELCADILEEEAQEGTH